MKINLKTLTALVGLSLAALVPAKAIVLTINDGLNGAVGGMVGTIDPGAPADLASEIAYINHLLSLGANDTDTVTDHPHSWDYDTTDYDFNGMVSESDSLNYPKDPPVDGPAGYEFVLAKLGNTAFVWYVGGEAFNLGSNFGPGNGLSHWAAFNSTTTNVPDGGTTAALLGLGLVAMSMIARRRAA